MGITHFSIDHPSGILEALGPQSGKNFRLCFLSRDSSRWAASKRPIEALGGDASPEHLTTTFLPRGGEIRARLAPMRSIESRLTDLEIRYTEQEDTIQKLDETIRFQQAEIEKLTAGLRHYADRVQAMGGEMPERTLEDEKPPHY